MVSYDGMICPYRRCPQVQGNIFGLLALAVVTYEILMLEGAHGWTYHYSNKSVSWKFARHFCQSKYTDMVAIQNMEENKYLNKYLPKADTHVWIGLRKIEGIWTWIGTNRALEDFVMNWAPGEPNNGKNTEECVEMYPETGKWNDEPCLKKKRPLCYNASCSPDSCSGHGECVETIGYYKCECNESFYGERCENAVNCGELKIPHSLLMNCSDPFRPFSYSSTCDFVCKDGFTLQGSDRLQCEASGQWTEKTPICKVLQCKFLKTPKRGIMNCRNPFGNFSYNSTCVFGCTEGFVLHGLGNLQCQASRQWTAEVPTCEAAKCTILENPEQGTINCSHPFGPFSYNATCDFNCEEGFILNGSDRVQCGASGNWTTQIPSCEVIAGLPPAASFLAYIGGSAAAVLLALVIGMIVAWMRKKLQKKEDDAKMLTLDSTEGTEDMFENPAFMNTPAGST
uniref:P-selectin-like isoform X1 n=2 Tax=Pristiophorus japonicus TaxID=55135 RepID=UPI00398E70BB